MPLHLESSSNKYTTRLSKKKRPNADQNVNLPNKNEGDVQYYYF